VAPKSNLNLFIISIRKRKKKLKLLRSKSKLSRTLKNFWKSSWKVRRGSGRTKGKYMKGYFKRVLKLKM